MGFVLVALWIAAALVLAADPRRSENRWLAAVAFFGGCGALASVTDDYWLPYAAAHAASEGLQQLLHRILAASSLASYFGMPAAFARFALAYQTDLVSATRRRTLGWLLLVPPFVTLLLNPHYPVTDYPVLAVWVVPYAVFGVYAMLRRPALGFVERRAHVMVLIAVLPAVLFSVVMNYLMPCFGIYGMWRLNVWSIALAFALFVIALFRYGFLGMQVLIRKRRLDSTLRAVTSGTAILHHAMKNDIGKIKLFSANLQREAELSGRLEAAADLAVIMAASRHMEEMILRVHEQTQDLALRITREPLDELLQDLLRLHAPALNGVAVSAQAPPSLVLECDRAQVLETLHNLVINAVEAMSARPLPETDRPQPTHELRIHVSLARKRLAIAVADTGCGIEKRHVARVLEPFFTTKGGAGSNYGLGLSYGYAVMRKHGGTLEVRSTPGSGTTVTLFFPLSRVITARRTAHNQEQAMEASL